MMKKSTESALRIIETAIPGLRIARTYRRSWLRADLFAGVTIFAMLVPQGMAYGELAGVASVVGLYTAIGALIGYAIFGSSRRLMVGPESSSALLVATAVAPIAAGGGPLRFAILASLLALLVGVIALVSGLARFGFLADFVSKTILIGYITGVAIVMIAGQLGKLFGIKIASENFFQMIGELLTNLGQTNVLTLVIGLVLLAFLIMLHRFAPKVPGGLIVVVVMTMLSALIQLDKYGVTVVGPIPSGLPQFGLSDFSFADAWKLLPSALILTLIVFTDSVLTARSFAVKQGEKVDANRELIGLGAANILSGCIQGFPASVSQSRTAVNYAAGGKTQLVGILAAVLIAVLLALLVVISRISRPHDAVLGMVEGVDGYQDIEAYTNSETEPGLIVYRFDAPLFFANADYFLSRVQELIATAEYPIKWMLIDAEAIIDIDVTAAEALSTLQSELERKGIVLVISRASQLLQEMFKRAGLTERIGPEHFYPTVRTGVQAFLEQQDDQLGKRIEEGPTSLAHQDDGTS